MSEDQNAEEPLYVASVPYGYGMLDPTKEGAWRVVSEDGRAVALLWTDFEDSTGISWVEQTDLVMKIRQLLSTMKMIGRSASIAYTLADTIEGADFGPHEFGTLSGAQDVYSKMFESKQQESQNDASNNE